MASYDSSINKNAFEANELFLLTEIVDPKNDILEAFPDQLDDCAVLTVSTNSDFLPFYIAEKFAELCKCDLIEVPVPIKYGDLPRTKDAEIRKNFIVSKVLGAFAKLLDDKSIVAFLLVYSSFTLGFFALKR